MKNAIFPYLPIEKILEALLKAPGQEVETGKLESPESSSALAVNTFGLFLDDPETMPAMPGTAGFGWPAVAVDIERCVRFPWTGGRHPWLDAYVETTTHIIGIESKRYEPFRGKSGKTFSDAYWRPVWGDHMTPFEAVRDKLKSGEISYSHLDAVQLVKHAFGLRSEATRTQKPPALVYLYAEPRTWPGGKVIPEGDILRHRDEAKDFSRRVRGAEVSFTHLSYESLLSNFLKADDPKIRDHAKTVVECFSPY